MERFLNQMDGVSTSTPAVTVVPLPFADVVGTETAAIPYSGYLISSDPKHAQGRVHATHFNEWSTVDDPSVALPIPTIVPKTTQEDTVPPAPLPQLDTEAIGEILDT